MLQSKAWKEEAVLQQREEIGQDKLTITTFFTLLLPMRPNSLTTIIYFRRLFTGLVNLSGRVGPVG